MFAGGDADRLVHVAPLPDVYRVTPADQVESPHDGGVTAAVERHLRVTRQMLNMARVGGRKVRVFFFFFEELFFFKKTLFEKLQY